MDKIVQFEDGGAMGTHTFHDDPEAFECAMHNNREWLSEIFRQASNRVELNELRRELSDEQVIQVTKYIKTLLAK